MNSTLHAPHLTELIAALYADAAQNDPAVRQAAREAAGAGKADASGTAGAHLGAMRQAYMAVPPEFGRLLNSLVRASRTRTVVEFGTSFGVSAIHLAAALRDNGGGRLITCEFAPEKAERAKKNLTDAGLADLVEFRVGDALQTLAAPTGEIDLLFLDGAKQLYIEVLKLLEPRLRSGALIVSDNTDHEGMETFLSYIRNPANGYTSSAILTPSGEHGRAHEVTVRH